MKRLKCRVGTVESTIIFIAFGIFALFAFANLSILVSKGLDDLNQDLGSEVADRIAKNLMLLDNVEISSVLLDLGSPYQVRYNGQNNNSIISVQYKSGSPLSSKQFTLKNQNFGSDSTKGKVKDIEKLCIVKINKYFWLIDSENPQGYLLDQGEIDASSAIDPAICKVRL